MGYGVAFETEVYISRYTNDNLGILKDDIEEKEYTVNRYKNEILMYASSNPKDIIPDEWKDEGIKFIETQINNIFESIEEEQRTLNQLYLYKDFLENNPNFKYSE